MPFAGLLPHKIHTISELVLLSLHKLHGQ